MATSADQALEILKTRSFELIVVDVNMPVLGRASSFYASLPGVILISKKVAITGYATEERRSACLASGAELFHSKNRTQQKDSNRSLSCWTNWSPGSSRPAFKACCAGSACRMSSKWNVLGRNSSILEVHDRQLTGRIYIEDGRIIHAIVGDITGEVAFQKLLSLAGGSFQLQHFEPAQRTNHRRPVGIFAHGSRAGAR